MGGSNCTGMSTKQEEQKPEMARALEEASPSMLPCSHGFQEDDVLHRKIRGRRGTEMVKPPHVRISGNTSKRTDDCVRSSPLSNMCYPHLGESESNSYMERL